MLALAAAGACAPPRAPAPRQQDVTPASIESALAGLRLRPVLRPTMALPDSAGVPAAALAQATAPNGDTWIGTYGRGIFVRTRTGLWRRIVSDTSSTSLSMDFIHAIAFDETGTVWVGTIGNGWGRSTDGGRTWKNWTFAQLGPEWRTAPNGILIHGDTVAIATADGLQVTVDDGEHWLALIDGIGPAAKGPADTALVALTSEYLLSIRRGASAWLVGSTASADALDLSACLSRRPCVVASARDGTPERPSVMATGLDPARPSGTVVPWFGRPIGQRPIPTSTRPTAGSTMAAFPAARASSSTTRGTPYARSGQDGWSRRAFERAPYGAIRHDRKLSAGRESLHVFSVYYHNSVLRTGVGARVAMGEVIAEVGHSGRATNDHLHLEVHAAPTDSVRFIVDSLNRYPPFTTNPELWIAPLPRTGVIAGTVADASGKPIPQARIYGIESAPRRRQVRLCRNLRAAQSTNPYMASLRIRTCRPESRHMGHIDGVE